MRCAANWTPRMLEQFRKLRGYDPVPWFPALTGVLIGTRAQSDAFLYDYRRTLADLMASEHYGTVARVAHDGLAPDDASLEAAAVALRTTDSTTKANSVAPPAPPTAAGSRRGSGQPVAQAAEPFNMLDALGNLGGLQLEPVAEFIPHNVRAQVWRMSVQLPASSGSGALQLRERFIAQQARFFYFFYKVVVGHMVVKRKA